MGLRYKAWRRPGDPDKFESDGCTLAPDFNFRDVCVKHDHDYWVGGTEQDRARADRMLRLGIRSRGQLLHLCLSWVYWVAVRLLGRPHFRYLEAGKSGVGG